MAEGSPDSALIKIVGQLITAAIGGALAWLPGWLREIEPAANALLAAAGGIATLAFSLMYKRYIGVLGAGGRPKGSPARDAYDGLRTSLSGGNLASRIYADWLTRFLDAVDRFFGDAGVADRTLFPRAFGLKTPAPLWTAPAFDRCLLLALAYPIATIYLIWAASGRVGPAETALSLPFDTQPFERWAFAATGGLLAFSFWRVTRFARRKSVAWPIAVSTFALAVLLMFGYHFAGTEAGSGAYVGITIAVVAATGGAVLRTDAGTGPGIIAGILFFPVAAVIFTIGRGAIGDPHGPVGNTLFMAGLVTVTGAFSFTVASLNNYFVKYQWQGIFLSIHVLAMIVLCLGAAELVLLQSRPVDWNDLGPSLLFLGLLTLINAPFDWASLGLTRALLRRGLELGGWWPYFLAIVDAILAAVIIATLAVTMVIGVQAFDNLAEHSGGTDARILPLEELFDGITENPGAPEYWWAYALLFSTMIPSLLNLMIGGASFIRGVPGLPSLLLRFMPAGKAVPPFDRQWLALVLTSQLFLGASLGIAAQAFLAIVVIFHILPWFGLELLDTARDVAEFDLPMRVMRLFGAGP
jgi:hypothetical protein